MFFENKRKKNTVHESFVHLPSKSTFVGNLKTDRAVRIDCDMKGDIITEGKIILSEDAKVEGNIKCKEALISGKVKGNIVAGEFIRLEAPAHIKGNILTKNIQIAEGAVIDGIYKIME